MTVTVGMFQGPEGLGSEPDVARNLAAIDAAAARAAAAGAQILVTPEMSVSGYDIGTATRDLARPRGGEYHAAIAGIAGRHGVAVVAGYPELDDGTVFNAVTVVSPNGAELAHYRKTHLFGDLDRTMFAPGGELPVQFDLGGLRCGLLICYDVEFPEAVRAQADAGADLLLTPTGLMEPFGRIAEQIVPVRAFESQLYIAYTNHCGRETSLEYCGLSTAAGPDGDVVARAGRAEELLVFTADPEALREARIANTYLRDRRTDLY